MRRIYVIHTPASTERGARCSDRWKKKLWSHRLARPHIIHTQDAPRAQFLHTITRANHAYIYTYILCTLSFFCYTFSLTFFIATHTAYVFLFSSLLLLLLLLLPFFMVLFDQSYRTRCIRSVIRKAFRGGRGRG